MYSLNEGLLSFHMMIQIVASTYPYTNGAYEHYNAINMIQIDASAYPCTNGAYGHCYVNNMIQNGASAYPCSNGAQGHYYVSNMIKIDASAYPCTNGAYGHYYKAITFRMLLTLPQFVILLERKHPLQTTAFLSSIRLVSYQSAACDCFSSFH